MTIAVADHAALTAPEATPDLSRPALMIFIESLLGVMGRRNIWVTISPQCECGCKSFAVRLQSEQGEVQSSIKSSPRLVHDIRDMIAKIPGAIDVH